MSKNYTDTTKPQTKARFFGIRRADKSGYNWIVEILEREYANMYQDDTDFCKDTNGFNFKIGVENLMETFPILDMETLADTGQTATIAQVFALIQSAYIAKAKQRDDALEQVNAQTEAQEG
jgi:hypothetical protein